MKLVDPSVIIREIRGLILDNSCQASPDPAWTDNLWINSCQASPDPASTDNSWTDSWASFPGS